MSDQDPDVGCFVLSQLLLDKCMLSEIWLLAHSFPVEVLKIGPNLSGNEVEAFLKRGYSSTSHPEVCPSLGWKLGSRGNFSADQYVVNTFLYHEIFQ